MHLILCRFFMRKTNMDVDDVDFFFFFCGFFPHGFSRVFAEKNYPKLKNNPRFCIEPRDKKRRKKLSCKT